MLAYLSKKQISLVFHHEYFRLSCAVLLSRAVSLTYGTVM